MDNGTHLYVNQAFNLLYILETSDTLDGFLTDEELGQLRLQVIAEWNDIDSPYMVSLKSRDRSVNMETLISGQRMFRESKESNETTSHRKQ